MKSYVKWFFIIFQFFLILDNGYQMLLNRPNLGIRISRDYSIPIVNDFKVYWNAPTFLCQKYGIDFKPHTQKFGIISNSKDSFRGKNINILYDPGLFPVVMEDAKGIKMERNGGIPQLGNITVHLEAFRQSIDDFVTQELNGVGIIDFESWRPVFRQNWKAQLIYRNMSKDLERQYHPQWPEELINQFAKVHFEGASREFMQKTLELAKILRPKARWGYYGFPYCYNLRAEGKPYCPENVKKENDEIMWLYKSSSALYPSLYMSSKRNAIEQIQFVMGRLNEAWRLAVQVSKTKFPLVYPFIWFKYHDSDSFLTKEDIYTSIEITRRYKMGGAIIWGASANVSSKKKCEDLLNYLHTVLGPALIKSRRNENNVIPVDPGTSSLKFPFFPRSDTSDYLNETKTETETETQKEPEEEDSLLDSILKL